MGPSRLTFSDGVEMKIILCIQYFKNTDSHVLLIPIETKLLTNGLDPTNEKTGVV